MQKTCQTFKGLGLTLVMVCLLRLLPVFLAVLAILVLLDGFLVYSFDVNRTGNIHHLKVHRQWTGR